MPDLGFRSIGVEVKDRESYLQICLVQRPTHPSAFTVNVSIDGIEAESDLLLLDADDAAANDARLQAIARWKEKSGRELPSGALAGFPILIVRGYSDSEGE